jgi:[NiFe] hydrogenase diaphorase moiety small subunit
MLVPRFPYNFPVRQVEPASPKFLLEHNRCVKCLRCVRGVQAKDGKNVFGALRRGRDKKIAVDSGLAAALSEAKTKEAMDRCPVGSILKKEVGFIVPVGRRKYDETPIGSDVRKAKG